MTYSFVRASYFIISDVDKKKKDNTTFDAIKP